MPTSLKYKLLLNNPSQVPMAVKLTGHAEIDQQHSILDSMVGELSNFCCLAGSGSLISCDVCASDQKKHCRSALASSASELTAFLVGHARYEEKLMELLPGTPKCRGHIREHKRAHQNISKQLKNLSFQLSEEEPRTVNVQMRKIVQEWLGDHTTAFDDYLVSRLDATKSAEIDFDKELVAILDEHVFQNRPTTFNPPLSDNLALQRKKLEIRGRFELLTPAQRSVFWLVVGGKRNKEIADQLGISVNTIKTHRAMVFKKMDVRSVLDLLKKTDVLR